MNICATGCVLRRLRSTASGDVEFDHSVPDFAAAGLKSFQGHGKRKDHLRSLSSFAIRTMPKSCHASHLAQCHTKRCRRSVMALRLAAMLSAGSACQLRKRACSKQERSGRDGQSERFCQHVREQSGIAVIRKKFNRSIHCFRFLPARSQKNWTLTRPYSSTQISSPDLPTTKAVWDP